jgi:hypothetical protein
MEDTPAESALEATENVIKQIIPGISPESVRLVAEDELGNTIPAPASFEVEEERIKRAQAEDAKG